MILSNACPHNELHRCNAGIVVQSHIRLQLKTPTFFPVKNAEFITRARRHCRKIDRYHRCRSD
ncbi:hypothetical protein BCAR13_80019 [Paraburkholderia caribensis]|nr:hypothetical protein BCAR13_80019 [Paraburkholderia caribensis]